MIHGAPYRFADPARFAMAHGGKDGHPFPVPLKVYDETIRVLKYAVAKARLGSTEELAAIKRLDAQARALERTATRAVAAGVHRGGAPPGAGVWRADGVRRCRATRRARKAG